jgi:hypothetical protein
MFAVMLFAGSNGLDILTIMYMLSATGIDGPGGSQSANLKG